jgi:hypothetical protein
MPTFPALDDEPTRRGRPGVTGSLSVLRGLWFRRGLSAMMLAVAVLAAAAATTGPLYYAAAKNSIVQDNLHAAKTIGQGVKITEQGPLPGQLHTIEPAVRNAFARTPRPGLFGRRIRSMNEPIAVGTDEQSTLVWRDGDCAHLRIEHGRCPRSAGEVVASTALIRRSHWHVGQRLGFGLGEHRLTIVGSYRPRHPRARYWFAQGYFPSQGPSFTSLSGSAPVDAMFTPRATFERLRAPVQGIATIDVPLRMDVVRAGDVAGLSRTINRFQRIVRLTSGGATPISGLPDVLDGVRASWHALLVPVFLVTAQLLALCWLLLFVVVADAAAARGPEVALAKLRGLSRAQTVRFGLTEPVALLLVALPLGALAGWAATVGLGSALLRDGTSVALTGLGWAAAAVAVAGGLIAAALAARRILARPVVAQWRRVNLAVRGHSWAIDAVLLAGTVAGLVELYATGTVSSGSVNVLALLVPGLLALTVAVLGSRVLPAACRLPQRWTRDHGGLASFLAVRQLARRPSGARTTIVLATAFGLAAFTIAAWSVSRSNLGDVAAARVGAPAVLTVHPRPGTSLPAIVDRLDPSGQRSMAVQAHVELTGQRQVLLAVDPHRFAAIASWRPDYTHASLATLARRLDPPAPDPIVLRGDRLRINLIVDRLSLLPRQFSLDAEVKAPNSTAVTPVDLGPLHHGHVTLTAQLPPGPSTLRRLHLEGHVPVSHGGPQPAVRGRIVLTGLAVHTGHGWRPVPHALTSAKRWRSDPKHRDQPPGRLTATASGLSLQFNAPSGIEPELDVVDRPRPLPVLASATAAPRGPYHTVPVTGLDGNPVAANPLAVVPVPGAPDHGVVVDRTYAARASPSTLVDATWQVWLADPSAVGTFSAKLRHAGVSVVGTQTAASLRDRYSRQGPALALVLFLADAAAAAILAAAGAVLALYLAGRRRTYELAALAATGARRRSLRAALLLEQGLTLGFGALVGIGAGILAAFLAVPAVPEFVHSPGAPALLYTPSAAPLAALLGAAVVLLAVPTVASVAGLVRAARPDQLREAPA